MKYRIILKPEARKELRKLKNLDYELIITTLHAIAEDPHSGDAKPLAGLTLWRRRVRDFRIVFSIQNEQAVVYIARIIRRSEKSYRGL